MRAAMTQLNLSARAYHHILKLARTIADLASSEDIHSAHLARHCTLRGHPKMIGKSRSCFAETASLV
jgi:magnesium chelatase family protein